MSAAVCILCGTNDHATLLYPATVRREDMNRDVFSARRMPDRLHGDMLRCTTCGLVYPRDLPDPEMLAGLYRESRHTYGEMEPFIRRTYLRFIRMAIRRLGVHSPLSSQSKTLASVDIGCGNGFLLQALTDLGFDASGIEPSADAIANADPRIRGKILHGMASPELLPPGSADLLTCFQTLDHALDPVTLVGLCHRALRPRGVALFINHDIGSLTARLLGERCPMIDIEHTYLHTKHTVHALFERAGFRDIAVFPVRNDYPLWYWLHLLPIGTAGKASLIAWSRKTGIGNITIPLYAGNLGLIATRGS